MIDSKDPGGTPPFMGRGGARPRSGRKPIPKEDRRVPLSCLVKQETRKVLEELSEEKDLSFGELVDLLVEPHRPSYLQTDTERKGDQ